MRGQKLAHRAEPTDRRAQNGNNLLAERDSRLDQFRSQPMSETSFVTATRLSGRAASDNQEASVFPTTFAPIAFFDIRCDRVCTRDLLRRQMNTERFADEGRQVGYGEVKQLTRFSISAELMQSVVRGHGFAILPRFRLLPGWKSNSLGLESAILVSPL